MEQEDKNLQAQPSETQEKPEKQPLPKGYEAYLSLFDLVRMLAVITLVFVFFFRLNGVSGSSMYPTLVDKDYLVLESNFLYRDAKQDGDSQISQNRTGYDEIECNRDKQKTGGTGYLLLTVKANPTLSFRIQEFGMNQTSPSRIRTYDQSVNSRPLYH